MSIDLDRAFSSLDDVEQILIEIEADARGVHVHTVLLELIREGLASDCMDEVLQPRDSQWKSH